MARTRKPGSARTSSNAPELSSRKSDVPDETTKGSKRKRESLNLDWDKEFTGFSITAPGRAGKKQKTDEASSAKHDDRVVHDPFPEAELGEVLFAVKPAEHWESMQRYRRCTLQEEVFSVGQMVFVKQEEGSKTSHSDAAVPNWIAKILEIRAHAPTHVFLRVYWAYRPEDLPEGRQPYHGKDELVVSNHMDIIEALTVTDSAEVSHWEDSPDESKWPKPDELFWRQSFDVTKGKKGILSKLNTYCIDNTPSIPFEPLIQCPQCSIYLHARCIEDRAIKDAFAAEPPGQPAKKKKKVPDPTKSFDADLRKSGSHLRLVLTDLRPGKKKAQTDLHIHCLSCKALMHSADDSTAPKTPAAQLDDDEAEEEEDDEINSAITASPNIKHKDKIKPAAKPLTLNPASPSAASQAALQREMKSSPSTG